MPLRLIPILLICSILAWMSSSELRSSPNLPEKGVASLSEASSLMAMRQRTLMLGASLLIFTSSSRESAVVNSIPFLAAQIRSLSSLIELE